MSWYSLILLKFKVDSEVCTQCRQLGKSLSVLPPGRGGVGGWGWNWATPFFFFHTTRCCHLSVLTHSLMSLFSFTPEDLFPFLLTAHTQPPPPPTKHAVFGKLKTLCGDSWELCLSFKTLCFRVFVVRFASFSLLHLELYNYWLLLCIKGTVHLQLKHTYFSSSL